jgi:hypothetical protein
MRSRLFSIDSESHFRSLIKVTFISLLLRMIPFATFFVKPTALWVTGLAAEVVFMEAQLRAGGNVVPQSLSEPTRRALRAVVVDSAELGEAAGRTPDGQ